MKKYEIKEIAIKNKYPGYIGRAGQLIALAYPIKLDFVKYGIANRFPGRIEINRKMLEDRYFPLAKEILEHELSHTDKGWSIKDLLLDLKGLKLKNLYRKFIISTPSSWVQYFPIYKGQDRKLYFDLTLIIFYIAALIVMGVLLWTILKH